MRAHRHPSTWAHLAISRLPLGNRGAREARTGLARFRPANPGAPALVQVRDGARWRTVVAGKQNRRGRFAFTAGITSRPGARYRAVTRPAGGGARVVSTAVAPQPWHRIFDDEFTGTRLDPAKWRTRIQPPSGRRLCSTPSSAMTRVRGGHAVLGIKRIGRKTRSCPHGRFVNAMIGTGETTTPGFESTYGLYAARVKFQSGRGQHGSFWMQSAVPGGAEIDVTEYFGDGRSDGGISNFVHKTSSRGALVSVGGVRPKVRRLLGAHHTPSNGWHVWSVQWSPSGYVFRVDDKVTMRTSRNRVATPEFLILSLLTSDWEVAALDTTKSTMKVDWVRAWQR